MEPSHVAPRRDGESCPAEPTSAPLVSILRQTTPESFDAPYQPIGHSREGREILGCRLGRGDRRLSLVGGAHADEPVGPLTLERLADHLAHLPEDDPLVADWSWWIVPHVNPDGAAVNAAWSEHLVPLPDGGEGYDLALYRRSVVRELPGDDIEFGYPLGAYDDGARPENRAVADFLATGAPFALHGSFHSIGFAAGPWFLLESTWRARTADLRRNLTERVRDAGYQLHDVDRGGEKGFTRIAEGFTTRPDSESMRDHFLARDEPEIAALFRPSSMEWVRSLGGDPLTFVSEMPLFLAPPAGRDAPDDEIRPMPLADQMTFQLAFLEECLRAVERYG